MRRPEKVCVDFCVVTGEHETDWSHQFSIAVLPNHSHFSECSYSYAWPTLKQSPVLIPLFRYLHSSRYVAFFIYIACYVRVHSPQVLAKKFCVLVDWLVVVETYNSDAGIS